MRSVLPSLLVAAAFEMSGDRQIPIASNENGKVMQRISHDFTYQRNSKRSLLNKMLLSAQSSLQVLLSILQVSFRSSGLKLIEAGEPETVIARDVQISCEVLLQVEQIHFSAEFSNLKLPLSGTCTCICSKFSSVHPYAFPAVDSIPLSQRQGK